MNILSLSNEILYQIFNNLDCLEIIAARSTCWRLHSIGKTRLLWESRVLEVSYSSGIPVLNGPMEAYTSEELEEKLITRARTRQKWRNFDPVNFTWQEVETDYPYQPPFELKLVPGGRWLLHCSEGNIYITDLDAEEVAFKYLFDLYDLGNRFLRSNIWIDTTKYWVSEARIAIYCGQASSGLIFIFQFNPMGRGMNTEWNVERMAIKKRRFPRFEIELHLEKEYVLAVFEEMRQSWFGVYLFQYSEGQHRSHEWVCDQQPKVLLLPNSRIGVVTQRHIEISVINPVGSHHLELQPILCTPLHPHPGPYRVFNPHSTLHFSYLNIAYQDALLEIRIPVNANEVSQKQITFRHGSIPTMWGLSLLVRLRDDWAIECISYELNDSVTDQVASRYCTIQRNVFRKWPRLIGCDVTAGQLIVSEGDDYMLIRI